MLSLAYPWFVPFRDWAKDCKKQSHLCAYPESEKCSTCPMENWIAIHRSSIFPKASLCWNPGRWRCLQLFQHRLYKNDISLSDVYLSESWLIIRWTHLWFTWNPRLRSSWCTANACFSMESSLLRLCIFRLLLKIHFPWYYFRTLESGERHSFIRRIRFIIISWDF